MKQVEKLLKKVDDIYSKTISREGLPDPVDVCRWEPNSWYKYNYQKLRGILHDEHLAGYCHGVFRTITAFDIDERNKRHQTFNNGDGI